LYVLGYGFRLEQALINLLDNAVKFNKPEGEVHVQVHDRTADKIEIRISDDGLGIPVEDRSRIFERFYRVDKARSRQVGGTGLGLSIVKHAVEQMGGTVTVESELGNGSTFIVTLPKAPPPQVQF
jgi:two-component system phosphate regulon sensor histidine kinase PhoR